MNDQRQNGTGPMIITFLAGATLGALLVALTTPKTGPELRSDLRRLAQRARGRAEDLAGQAGDAWEEVQNRSSQAAEDFKRGVKDAARDLQA